MYHCHVCFYFIGNQSQLFNTVKSMPALASFDYEFMESKCINEELAAKADVILADLSGLDAPKEVDDLVSWGLT